MCDCGLHVLMRTHLIAGSALTDVSSNEPNSQSSGDRRDSLPIYQTVAAGLALSVFYGKLRAC